MKTKILIFFLRVYFNILAIIAPKFAGAQAYKILARPRGGQISESDNTFLSTADAREVLDYQGIKTQTYFWKGERACILLAHGWQSNAARWQRLIDFLKKENYTIIALDAPGHGNSGNRQFNPKLYAEMLNEVVKKYKPVGLVGHSVGGYTLAFWRNFFLTTPPSVFEPKFYVLLAPLSDNRVIFDKYFDIIGLSKRFQRVYYAFYEKKFNLKFADVVAADFAKKFDKPALIIHDRFDDIAPIEGGEAIYNAWKGSEIIITENLGHRLRDDSVYEMIMHFLKKHA